MININSNFSKLDENYLFAKIASERQKYDKKHLIDLSIGDVTLPLVKSSVDGIIDATKKLSDINTFEGYPPSSGHDFLKECIITNDYPNIPLKKDEIFISDSSKSDINYILDIFSDKLNVAIKDPVYPVYVDSNILHGNNIIYYSDINELMQKISDKKIQIDILYICSPNNPTGEVITKEQLNSIISLAKSNNFIIFFDSAYEAFIQDKDIPHSIYEINGAKNVAIEFRSYSKTAGFTPLRLAYTVIPKEILINNTCINHLYKRLKDTRYNGPSYLSEYAIYNTYNKNKIQELKDNIYYYLKNTEILSDFFYSKNMLSKKQTNSPYVWIKIPDNTTSWEFFYYLIEKCLIVGTPGSGFGKNGEGYFRLTGFNTYENTLEAVERLKKVI